MEQLILLFLISQQDNLYLVTHLRSHYLMLKAYIIFGASFMAQDNFLDCIRMFFILVLDNVFQLYLDKFLLFKHSKTCQFHQARLRVF